MARELIDTVPDADGDTAELGVDDDGAISLRLDSRPYTRKATVVFESDGEVERFGLAWSVATAKRARIRGEQTCEGGC